MAASSSGGTGREESAKSAVAEQISQFVQSTSNILHLMLESSQTQARLAKLPKGLLDKTRTVKNTELVLAKLPQLISSLDEHVERGLRSAPHLDTVIQLLTNMHSSQLQSLPITQHPQQEPKNSKQHEHPN